MVGDQIVSPKEKIYIRIEVRSSFYRFSLCSGYVLESVLYLEKQVRDQVSISSASGRDWVTRGAIKSIIFWNRDCEGYQVAYRPHH